MGKHFGFNGWVAQFQPPSPSKWNLSIFIVGAMLIWNLVFLFFLSLSIFNLEATCWCRKPISVLNISILAVYVFSSAVQCIWGDLGESQRYSNVVYFHFCRWLIWGEKGNSLNWCQKNNNTLLWKLLYTKIFYRNHSLNFIKLVNKINRCYYRMLNTWLTRKVMEFVCIFVCPQSIWTLKNI